MATDTVEQLLERALAAQRDQSREADVPPPPVYLAPDRFVTVRVYATITGRTENSMRMKMRDGKWLEGREYIKDPDGTVLIDREGVQRWALQRH